jgi:CMP-N-acetylneuraminic acid synthetase
VNAPSNILAVIPIRSSDAELRSGHEPLLGDRPLFDYTFRSALEAKSLSRRIVSTDAEWIAQRAREAGLEAPFLRPPELDEIGSTTTDVMRHCVQWLEENEGYRTDWVVLLEITHPFRLPDLIDRLVHTVLTQDVDSGFLAYREVHSYWVEGRDGQPRQVGQDAEIPRGIRRPIFRDMGGLASMFRVSNLYAGRRYGNRVALVPCDDVFAFVDLHDPVGALLAETIVSSGKVDEQQ